MLYYIICFSFEITVKFRRLESLMNFGRSIYALQRDHPSTWELNPKNIETVPMILSVNIKELKRQKSFFIKNRKSMGKRFERFPSLEKITVNQRKTVATKLVS